jgi:phosphatidate cytidylyltransferase
LLQRILTGLVVTGVLLGAWFLDQRSPGLPAWWTAALGVIVTFGALDELQVMGAARGGRRRLGKLLGLAWIAILALPALRPGEQLAVLCGDVLIGASIIASVYVALQLPAGPGPVAHRLAGSLWFQLPYVGGLACFVALLLGGALDWAVAVVLVTKSSDIGAYFAGRAFGRRRLAPRISPNKTVEGAVGGILLPALVAMWLLPGVHLAPHARPELILPGGLLSAALHGAVIGALAIVSDLSESLLKRSRSVKDSGQLLGQGGGLLDLADSLLLVGPFALAYTAVLA